MSPRLLFLALGQLGRVDADDLRASATLRLMKCCRTLTRCLAAALLSTNCLGLVNMKLVISEIQKEDNDDDGDIENPEASTSSACSGSRGIPCSIYYSPQVSRKVAQVYNTLAALVCVHLPL